MIYYNTKTGAVVESENILTGKNWQAIEPANSAISEEESKPKKSRKRTKKVKTEPVEQDVDSTEAVYEETTAEAAHEETPEEEQ